MPDFFIIGAPKCGTTSLQRYLANHPNIGFSPIKEPLFFCGKDLSTVPDYDAYLRLFTDCATATLLGEASALYLYYQEAVPRILRVNPAAKFIVMVRNPIDMAISYHNQTRYSFEQMEPSFERAWALTAVNARMGRNCRDPRLLDYRAICRLGAQVARLHQLVDPTRTCVIVFDDLCPAPEKVCATVLRFLGLPEFELSGSAVFNPRMTHRFPKIGEALLAPGPFLGRIKKSCQRRSPIMTKNVGRFLLQLIRAPGKAASLDPRFRAEMAEEMAEDVRLLGHLIGRNLEHWLAPQAGSSAIAHGALSGTDRE